MSNSDKAIRTIYFSILTNFLLALVKWFAGFFGHSHALIADAIESTTDIFSSFLVFLYLLKLFRSKEVIVTGELLVAGHHAVILHYLIVAAHSDNQLQYQEGHNEWL